MSKEAVVIALRDQYEELLSNVNLHEKVVHTHSAAIDFFADNPGWLRAFPRIWDGELLANRPPDILVPNETVAHQILYAGCRDYASLSHFTQEKIAALDSAWQSPVLIYPRPEDDGSSKFSVETDEIHALYDFLSAHFEGEYRGTGEPRFAHEQRMVLRALDVIREVNHRWDKGDGLFKFTPEAAKVWIMMVLAHDYKEKEKDRSAFDRDGWRSETRTHYVVDSNPKAQGFYFTEAMVHKDGKVGKVLKSLRIPLQPYEMEALESGLNALDSSGLDGEATMHHLDSLAFSARYGHMSEVMFRISPFLTKVIDRDDNVPTRTFELNPKSNIRESEPRFIPRGHEGVVKKAQETINSFRIAERMFMMLSASRHPYGTQARIMHSTKEPFSTTYFRRQLPSRWAALTLFGLGPNEIYGRSPEAVYQPRVAEMI